MKFLLFTLIPVLAATVFTIGYLPQASAQNKGDSKLIPSILKEKNDKEKDKQKDKEKDKPNKKVPSPILLPGFIALGAAILYKRRAKDKDAA